MLFRAEYQEHVLCETAVSTALVRVAVFRRRQWQSRLAAFQHTMRRRPGLGWTEAIPILTLESTFKEASTIDWYISPIGGNALTNCEPMGVLSHAGTRESINMHSIKASRRQRKVDELSSIGHYGLRFHDREHQ